MRRFLAAALVGGALLAATVSPAAAAHTRPGRPTIGLSFHCETTSIRHDRTLAERALRAVYNGGDDFYHVNLYLDHMNSCNALDQYVRYEKYYHQGDPFLAWELSYINTRYGTSY